MTALLERPLPFAAPPPQAGDRLWTPEELDGLPIETLVKLIRGVSGAATAPQYAATPNVGAGLLHATLDTSLTAPTNTTTIVTGAATHTKVEELDSVGVGTTVAGVLNFFLHDGSTAHLFDQLLVTAVTSSTTAIAFRQIRQYTNLMVKNGWTLKIAGTVSGNQSMIKVTAFGADL